MEFEPNVAKAYLILTQRLLNELPRTEKEALVTLALWDGSFPSELLRALDIHSGTWRKLLQLGAIVQLDDEVPGARQLFFLNPLWGALLSAEVQRDYENRHLSLARFLQRDIITLMQKASQQPIPFELLSQVDGSPVSEEQLDIIQNMMALRFVQNSIEQTQAVGVAKLSATLAMKWHHHLLEGGDFDSAFGLLTILYWPLNRWGRLDEAKDLLDSTVSRWMKADPEKELWIQLRVSSEIRGMEKARELLDILFPPDGELLELRERTFHEGDHFLELGINLMDIEEYEGAQKMLASAYDIYAQEVNEEGRLMTLFHTAELNFWWKKPREALEANGIALQLARELYD